MSKLKDDLAQILQEKQDKIKPENIKKGIQIFDIEGTYEGNSSNVKLFETQEEMQVDTTAKEGDLAVVYRNEVNNMTVDTQPQFITFPETVTLPSTITESYYCMLRAVDTSKMFEGNIMLDQNSFRFDGYSRNGMIRVMYTSSDGITYTRTEFSGDSGDLTNPVDLETMVHCEMPEEWNDAFGYFMLIGGSAFEGLYKCDKIKVENDVVKFVPLSSLTITVSDFNVSFSWDGTSVGDYNTAKMREMTQKISTELSKTGFYAMSYFIDTDDDLCVAFTKKSLGQSSTLLLYKNDNTPHWGVNINPAEQVDVYKVNLDEMSYSLKSTLDQTRSIYAASTYYMYDIKSKTLPVNIPLGSGYHSISTYWVCSTESASTSKGYKVGYYTPEGYETSHDEFRYFIAPSQLTATSENIYNAMAYGENGIIEGTLTTSPSNSFADTNAEVYYKLQQAYENMEPRVLTDSDKEIDKNIYFIPTNGKGQILLDTSALTDAKRLFSGCKNLKEIPLLDTNNVMDMSYMFENCENLMLVPLLNMGKVTKAEGLFDGCMNLQEIPLLDTSHVTDMSYMFNGCTKLKEIPLLDTGDVVKLYYTFTRCESLVTLPLLNTQNVENITGMVQSCTNLVNLPLLDTRNITDMYGTFSYCNNLSDESLNNILQMCINATKYNRAKRLETLGLTEQQANRCTTLGNYEAFTAAGWTTGY